LVSFRLSYFTLLMRVVWRNLVVFLYQLIVFIALALILQLPITVSWIIAPFALLAITMVALWMALLMSVFATRFRDLSELMNNLLRLVFFVTPIMWIPSPNTQLSLVADLNPFYHLIEVFRAPVLTGDINLQNWIVVSALLFVGWLIAFPVFATFRSRIAFWL
jgi:ABC-type polysaccharide/polyol phosphate export permease